MNTLTCFLRERRKAVAGLLAPLASALAVDQLGGSEQLALAVAAVVTAAVVERLGNLPCDDETHGF